jgi:hypothetical protein
MVRLEERLERRLPVGVDHPGGVGEQVPVVEGMVGEVFGQRRAELLERLRDGGG